MQEKLSSLESRSLALVLALGALGRRLGVTPRRAERAGAIYDPHAQQWDRNYAERYSEWAARWCVDSRRRNNAGAGAVIGGVMGAIIGSSVAGSGNRGAGAVAGGALGAMTGAAVGSSTSAPSNACPPGFVVRSGAPAFRFGVGYTAGAVVGPSWYNPWFWTGDRWVYRPYRYWYWNNQAYWRPGTRHGRWNYRYRRW
jgi:hypothetical protein